MTDENARKKYAKLKGLIAGKVKTGNPVRDDLIISDAERHLADLISKRPNINFEDTKPEVKNLNDEVMKEPVKPKSKEKK